MKDINYFLKIYLDDTVDACQKLNAPNSQNTVYLIVLQMHIQYITHTRPLYWKILENCLCYFLKILLYLFFCNIIYFKTDKILMMFKNKYKKSFKIIDLQKK